MSVARVAAAVVLAALSPAAPSGSAATEAASARPAPEAAGALLRRCVQAYGGTAALSAARRVRQEGTVTSLLHPGEVGRIVRAYERPGRLRVEIVYPGGGGEVRVLDGSHGWRDGEEVAGPRLAAMILQAARLDLPALLGAWAGKVVDEGTLVHEGRTLRVLAIDPAPGLVVQAAIDPESGRILRSRGASRAADMPGIEFVTTYSDFRSVGGVLVPFREQNWANGRTTGETVLQKVELPERFPEGAFGP